MADITSDDLFTKKYDSTFVISAIKHVGGYAMLWGEFSSKRADPFFQICSKMKDARYKDNLQD